MFIEIHSFNSIEALTCESLKKEAALISIVDSERSTPDLKNQPDYILQLVFGDTCIETSRAISNKQAQKIADFVFEHKDRIDLLICQCVFGKSRSAGCAAAISEFFTEMG